MCGIAGIIYLDSSRHLVADRLREMAAAIAHRGPDAEGVWISPGVGLAHRRLSIIHLAGGDQPIGNEDGSNFLHDDNRHVVTLLETALPRIANRFRLNAALAELESSSK